jgi:hypothetical protein
MTRIEDAFRLFEPSRQRGRMVTLFLGLCHEAGLVSEDRAPKVQTQPRRQRQSERSKGQQAQRAKAKPEPSPLEEPPVEEAPRRESEDEAHDYPAVNTIVARLPKNRQWTKKRRELWMRAMVSTVDLEVEIIGEEEDRVYEGEVMPDLELER